MDVSNTTRLTDLVNSTSSIAFCPQNEELLIFSQGEGGVTITFGVLLLSCMKNIKHDRTIICGDLQTSEFNDEFIKIKLIFQMRLEACIKPFFITRITFVRN